VSDENRRRREKGKGQLHAAAGAKTDPEIDSEIFFMEVIGEVDKDGGDQNKLSQCDQ
jgi:hypothetical protein